MYSCVENRERRRRRGVSLRISNPTVEGGEREEEGEKIFGLIAMQQSYPWRCIASGWSLPYEFESCVSLRCLGSSIAWECPWDFVRILLRRRSLCNRRTEARACLYDTSLRFTFTVEPCHVSNLQGKLVHSTTHDRDGRLRFEVVSNQLVCSQIEVD